jgi:zinc protease
MNSPFGRRANVPVDLKRRGFSRAGPVPQTGAALAAEGMQMAGESFPRGLKPTRFFSRHAARLKSCPDTSCLSVGLFRHALKSGPDTSCLGTEVFTQPARTRLSISEFWASGFSARRNSCLVAKRGPAVRVFSALFAGTIFASMLSPLTLSGQQEKPWDKIPVPKLHEFRPEEPKRIELKNGIVIFLEEDHELPFVSGSVLIPGGSRDESPAKAGLVGLYGQAWRTSGTAKMDGDALDDLLEAKAAHIETAGDDDSTALSWDSLKGDADQVFGLAMELLLHPKFSQEKLELAAQQEATGIVRRNDDESAIAERESAKLVYGANGPYTRQPELATIGAVTVEDLKAWHDRTVGGKLGGGKLGGGRLIVAVSGDFDAAAMEAKLRAAFEGLPPTMPAPVRHDVFTGAAPGVYFINKADVNQSDVQIVGMGIDRRNPDVPTVAVMNEILGGGFASRLFQTVRTKLGLAYEVGGGISFGYDHPGPFSAVVLTKSATTVDATKATLDEIAGLNTRPFTEEELARAKDNLLSSFLFRYDTRDKVLAERVRLEFYGYPADYLESYEAALKRVTVADLEAAAKKYIHPDKLAVLVVGNGPEIKPGLDGLNLGAVKRIDITIPQPGGQAGRGGAAPVR